MANFCKKCGAPLNPTSKFCTKCGAQIVDSQAQPIPPQPRQMPQQGPMPQQRPMQQMPPQSQQYQQPFRPVYPTPAKSQSDNNPLIIGLLVLVVLLLGAGIGYYMYTNAADSGQANYSKIDQKSPGESSSIEKDAPVQSEANLDELIREKDSIDTAIGEMANRINSHLSSHSSFRGYDGLKNDAKALVDRANHAKDRLNAMHVSNTAKKEALMNLFSLEVDRAQGLYKGIVDNQNGGDYSLGFQQGTKASYSFDAANSSFQANYNK